MELKIETKQVDKEMMVIDLEGDMDVFTSPHLKETIIKLLKDKTKGNLTEEEQNLLEHLLYDLRMRFVKASQG